MFTKRIDQNMLFYSNKQLICISCPIVCKIFFLLQILRYSGKVVEKIRRREAITKKRQKETSVQVLFCKYCEIEIDRGLK